MLLLAVYLVDEHEFIWYVCVLFLQTNGLTERFNQTISRCLAKLVDDSQTDWDEKIDVILMGYRASQASTKHSPYFLFFQQQMHLPIDSEVLLSSFDQEGDDEEDLDQKIQILQERKQSKPTSALHKSTKKKHMTENTRHK